MFLRMTFCGVTLTELIKVAISITLVQVSIEGLNRDVSH